MLHVYDIPPSWNRHEWKATLELPRMHCDVSRRRAAGASSRCAAKVASYTFLRTCHWCHRLEPTHLHLLLFSTCREENFDCLKQAIINLWDSTLDYFSFKRHFPVNSIDRRDTSWTIFWTSSMGFWCWRWER